MTESHGTYDSPAARSISLSAVLSLFSHSGVDRVYVKKLAPNDNSKNQLYLGGHLSELAFLPIGELQGVNTDSRKTVRPGRSIRYLAALPLSWIDAQGQVFPAPNAKLIYYPQYPEVRFSGFLQGSRVRASKWMAPEKSGRVDGRWLIVGVSSNTSVYAYLVTPQCKLSDELESINTVPTSSVLRQISVKASSTTRSTRETLLLKLQEIHQLGWVTGKRLDKDGNPMPYKAPNGGGYTLEALLGIVPNGHAEPDYLGWEVKQFGVSSFRGTGAKPTTLMTPEPNGGLYSIKGVVEFLREFGYPDRSGISDRINFGGIHSYGVACRATDLVLDIVGFDIQNGKITDANGKIMLINNSGKNAASWSFPKLMGHWKRKHSQAAFVPCRSKNEAGQISYHYGNRIELGTGTEFELLLQSFVNRAVYYDPGIKLVNASSSNPTTKRRSQFRVKHKDLSALYSAFETVSLDSSPGN